MDKEFKTVKWSMDPAKVGLQSVENHYDGKNTFLRFKDYFIIIYNDTGEYEVSDYGGG